MTTKLLKQASLIFLFIFISISSYATEYTAVVSGNFSDPNTWSPVGVPGSGDDIVIDGFLVNHFDNSTISVRDITIQNSVNSLITGLSIGNGGHITANAVYINALKFAGNIQLMLTGAGQLSANSLSVSRANDNREDSFCKIQLSNDSELTIANDFEYYYGDAGNGENDIEIAIDGSAIMDIGGLANFILNDGEEFDIVLSNFAQMILRGDVIVEGFGGRKLDFSLSDNTLIDCKKNLTIKNHYTNDINFALSGGVSVNIDSNLILNSLIDNSEIFMVSSSSIATLEVGKDIVMNATTHGMVKLDFNSGGSIRSCGNFSRSPYGALEMGENSLLILSGTNIQNVPSASISGAGTDTFNITNINIENTSGEAMSLTGPLTVKRNLNLTEGIIKTTDTNILIVEDGATITGGGDDAYIDGPMIKRGSTNGSPFIFPLGGGNQYAPIEISALSNAGDQYTAQYFGCPPPFGNDIATSMTRISSSQYWTLEKSGSGTPDVDVTLHWTDAEKQGIDDTTSLVVAFFQVDEVVAADSEWISLGRSNATGNLGAGMAGRISNDYGCPPPFGNDVSRSFTFGSTSSSQNILPVELVSFSAKTSNDAVQLDWRTANEINSDYFEVLRSYDGINFEVIEQIASAGNSSVEQYYKAIDKNPFELNYYRLRQVDLDGTYTYSDIIVLSVNSRKKTVLFPNPVVNEINLYTDGYSNNEVEVTIYDQNGRSVFREVYPMQNSLIRIDEYQIGDLGPGTYYIETINEFGSSVQPFTKINR